MSAGGRSGGSEPARRVGWGRQLLFWAVGLVIGGGFYLLLIDTL